MRGKRLLIGLAGGALLALSCSEITTRTETARFVVVLDASSPILESQGDTLVLDTPRFSVTVFEVQGADSLPLELSAPVFASDSPDIVQIDAASGAATLKRTGTATVSVTFSADVFPDSLLRGELVVPVDSFSVEITASSATIDAGAGLLQSDTVRFAAAVSKKDGTPVATQGQRFVSGNPAVVRFIDDTAGVAVLEDTGQAQVSVGFDRPQIPQGTLTGAASLSVSDFSLTLGVASEASGAIASGDTLATDTVQFSATLVKDGAVQPIDDPTWTSSDPAVVEILDPTSGRAYFAGAGTATVRLSFTSPVVPQRADSMVVNVGTFTVQMGGPASPVMGDTVFYTATVTDTRSGRDTVASGPTFQSTDPGIVRVLNSTTGMSFARDLGQADVSVTFTEPRLPNAPVMGSLPVTISEERFYGTFSTVAADFGDPVFVDSSGVHTFTDSTRVLFGNGAVGFVTSVTPELLRFSVGAGTDTSQLLLFNVKHISGAIRDSVLTRITFQGGGTVDDPFEPNDTFPLTNAHEITAFPFEALLSWDPSKSAPADTNFFWFTVGVSGVTLDIRAAWQQDGADLDFVVCSGNGAPPTDYVFSGGNPICQRPAGNNSTQPYVEQETGLALSAGVYVVAFYCVNCPAVPLTYSVSITQR